MWRIEAGYITTEARAWETYIRELLVAAGGAGGRDRPLAHSSAIPAGRSEFHLPLDAARDERFHKPGVGFQRQCRTSRTTSATLSRNSKPYSTEVLAAETVAVVLFSLRDMPWQFQLDSARHLYDEIRHALMGYEWMRKHGIDPFKSPQYLQVFRWRSQFPPAMQYCMLTMGNEVHAFPYRHRRVEAHKRSGDALSEQFVRYDIADETQHVRFGKRWLPDILRHVGERRSLEQYTAEALTVRESQYGQGQVDHQRGDETRPMPLVRDPANIRLAILGSSPGNGHPYSWAAMFNGYDRNAMTQECPFAGIPQYLNKEPTETLRIPGATVTHVCCIGDGGFTAEHVAKCSLIPHVVEKPADVHRKGRCRHHRH